MKMTLLSTGAVICLLIVVLIQWKQNDTQAQTKDVDPYVLSQLSGDVYIYKAVYQGCELFIVRGHAVGQDHADSVAITTGRGCK
jgi:hypothetical protein